MATRTKTGGKRKMARKTAKSSARKGAAKKGAAKKRTGRKMAASSRKRGTPRKAARKNTTRSARVARVKRVAQEVVHQAQGAVAAGVETLKDLSENLMDRVRST